MSLSNGLGDPQFCTHSRVSYRCADCKAERLERENAELRREIDRLRVLVGDTSEWPTPVVEVKPVTRENES